MRCDFTTLIQAAHTLERGLATMRNSHDAYVTVLILRRARVDAQFVIEDVREIVAKPPSPFR